MTVSPSVYGNLIKYKLSLAVVLSSLSGYFLFHNYIGPQLFFLAAGIFLLASGSAALNQYTERRTDSMMERTRNRPIPSKKLSPRKVLWTSVVLLFSGLFFLFFNGIAPLILGFSTVVLYNLIYTILKKTTVLSIIPGALVGALPPMIGYTSAGGSLLNQYIIAFALFMFLWQLPHFWLIIIKYGKEYSAAGFATILKYLTEIQIRYLVFFWVLVTTGFLFLFFGLTEVLGTNILLLISVLNLGFIISFYLLLFRKNGTSGIKWAFIMINSVSFLIMFLIIAISTLKGS
jgi:protoheme IX farnesyltransferase